jgi:hypothetical protein
MSSETVPRRRWPWVIVAAVVVAVVVALLAVHFADGSTAPRAATSSTPSPNRPSPVADPAPTGCLGGPQRNAAMILKAQKLAPHTTNGAVEVATAFVRWLNQYPYPSAGTYAEIEKTGLSSSAPTQDLAKFFASDPNLSGGLVPDGTTYYPSTVPGVYHVESAATDSVSASIGTGFVVQGVLSPTIRGSITVTVQWEDGVWKFVSSKGTRTTEDLFSIGTPFTDGC